MARKAGDGEGGATALTVGQYRGKVQRRSGRVSDFTEAKARRFCEVLADTCNVTLAAAAIGRSISNVYKHKTKNASFRASWDAALAMGYSRLELMLLERALHGVEKVGTAKDGTCHVMREYPDRVALALLRMHRETVAITGETIDDQEHEEARERLVERLGRLREREGIATKAARDVIGLIRWGLEQR